jgi:hypothetical protein
MLPRAALEEGLMYPGGPVERKKKRVLLLSAPVKNLVQVEAVIHKRWPEREEEGGGDLAETSQYSGCAGRDSQVSDDEGKNGLAFSESRGQIA